mmetsp:Transcript_21325/g.35162  ORF Transcript_21325/g.35162 Transcript_21325/m.35162 type:complete len:126 (+) Transcript_21325:499-876(+)
MPSRHSTPLTGLKELLLLFDSSDAADDLSGVEFDGARNLDNTCGLAGETVSIVIPESFAFVRCFSNCAFKCKSFPEAERVDPFSRWNSCLLFPEAASIGLQPLAASKDSRRSGVTDVVVDGCNMS